MRPDARAVEVLAAGLREQAMWCARLDSPLYAHILERAAGDVEAGGPAWRVLQGHESDPAGTALALRFVSAVHRLVLEGRAPDLARFYPSAGGEETGDAWPAFRGVLEKHEGELRRLVLRPCQTNEVGRCTALLGGFLVVAAETGLPLALREIGASAGLNLRWDRYRYDSFGETFGDPESPVRFVEPFEERRPPFDVRVEVAERLGCDLDPVDPTTEEGGLTLLSFLWPDQRERVERLRSAIEVARRVPATVDRADAAEWLGEKLAAPGAGAATVVFHSVVQSYLSAETGAEMERLLIEAGRRATESAPVAWLRMEHVGLRSSWPAGEPWSGPPDVRLTMWPGGEERVLATCRAHGPPVRWLGDDGAG